MLFSRWSSRGHAWMGLQKSRMKLAYPQELSGRADAALSVLYSGYSLQSIPHPWIRTIQDTIIPGIRCYCCTTVVCVGSEMRPNYCCSRYCLRCGRVLLLLNLVVVFFGEALDLLHLPSKGALHLMKLPLQLLLLL